MATRNDALNSPRSERNAPRAADAPGGLNASSFDRALFVALSVVVGLAAVAPRTVDLGLRALWLDECSTWHVARLPLLDSFRWPPEITIPPLYQLCVRALFADKEPMSEWMLRLPAAVAGVALVPVVWWLGHRCGGRWVGLAVAALVALHPLSIEYSREARPYSLLQLFGTLASVLWLELLRRPRAALLVAYVTGMMLALYSHVLAVPLLAAHASLLVTKGVRAHRVIFVRGWGAIGACLITMIPLALRVILNKSALNEALSWNPALTPTTAWSILSAAGFGAVWSTLLIGSVVVTIWLVLRARRGASTMPAWVRSVRAFEQRALILLVLWVLLSIGALVAAAMLGMPLVAKRYLLAATPAILLLPLLVLRRAHRFAPLAAALCFVAPGLPDSIGPPITEPGLRELMRYIRTNESSSATVLTAVSAHSESFRELEMLGAKYYAPQFDLWVNPLMLSDELEALGSLDFDGRIYLIVMLGDPLPLITKAGRTIEPVPMEDTFVTQLLYPPYRLIALAPKAAESKPPP
ncbi:MAG: glycosyltransferase family 39 protein [Phycisphaerales bacterium]|nr:glycosyltransferase family 39 protein [Phycisphaerales bacterium]